MYEDAVSTFAVTCPAGKDTMELTLSQGCTVSLPNSAVAALRGAGPLPGRTDLWCPDTRDSGTVTILVGQGLAERVPEGVLVLTPRGLEARTRAVRLLGLTEEAAGDLRATIGPEVVGKDSERLRAVLAEATAEGVPRHTVPQEGWGRPVLRISYALVLATVAAAFLLDLSFAGVLTVLVSTGLVVGSAHLVRARRQRKEGEADPVRILESFQGRYVTSAMLDEEALPLLGRARGAVDTVLGSPLHEQGLLLDTVRNRVVLADVEWSIANSLLHQTRARKRIDATPTPGGRSLKAAARARAALAEEAVQVTARIEVLEDYADRVRAAELEDQDRRSARELDAIAAEAAEAGAVCRQQDEGLESLVRAQELALQVAASAGMPEE